MVTARFRIIILLCLGGFSFVFSGCAHNPAGSKESSFRVSDPEPPKVVDQELEQIPTEMNERVEQWINYFQGRGRGHMERYLSRSTRYSKLMKRILRQNGLPEDLIYIALIESGFSSRATSRAAAVGYWQFIRSTGKRYGLEINNFVDERRDPVVSTQAAADYFKGLYSVFGSWYLAMASYNVGENRVKREVMNHYTRDFWELARKRRFPRETINYIPKFIAAKIIGNDPEKYGFKDLEYEKPIEFDLVKVDKAVNLRKMAEAMGVEYEEFKRLNPRFRGEIAPLKTSSLELRVPIGQAQQAIAAIEKSGVDKVEYVADAGETSTYKVRRGDSLYTIARKYRTTVAWLRDSNDIPSKRKLRIGQRLQVPERSNAVAKNYKVAVVSKPKAEEIDKATVNPEVTTAEGTYYIVQSGDTLSAIADDYDSSINVLRRMNNLGKGSLLKVGMKLRVPKDDALPSEPQGVAKSSKPVPNTAETLVQQSTTSAMANLRIPGAVGPLDGLSHVVKAGENLTLIAKKYGVSVQAIQKENRLTRRSVLKVGIPLRIPGVSNGQSRKVKLPSGKYSLKNPSKEPPSRIKVHIVKRGENLSHIANIYAISLNQLKEKNRLPNGSKLFVGSKLLVPVAQTE